MSNTPEYERGYKDGTKDCHALYGRILDRICMALDEKGEKEQAKKSKKNICWRREKRLLVQRKKRGSAKSVKPDYSKNRGSCIYKKQCGSAGYWNCQAP